MTLNSWTVVQQKQFQALRETCRQALARDPLINPHTDFHLELHDKLGEGGMGVVYRVTDKRLKRPAALKLLSPRVAHRPLVSERFLREARITAKLNHPSIPPIYEAGRDASGQIYMLMRLIRGQSLTTLIKDHHRQNCPWPRTLELLQILLRITEAVAYAHDRRIIHRDLKPDNIMVGEFGEVLVLDWGLAKELDGQNDDAMLSQTEWPELESTRSADRSPSPEPLTQAGSALGTPGFMAPEQACGSELDERADVFALGAILHAILTAKNPIKPVEGMDLITATACGLVRSPRMSRPDCPRELDRLAQQALQPVPDKRLASAEHFLVNLQAFLKQQPLPSLRYSLLERLLQLTRAHPTLMIVGALLIMLLSVLAFGVERLGRNQAEQQTIQQHLSVSREKKAEAEQEAKARDALNKVLAEANQLIESSASAVLIDQRLNKALEMLRVRPEGLDLNSEALTTARLLLKASGRGQARALLKDLIKNHPPAYEALFLLHSLESQESRRTGVLQFIGVFMSDSLKQLIERAQERGDSNEFTLMAKGMSHVEKREYLQAIDIFDRIEKRYSNRLAALFNARSECYFQLGKFKEALKDVQEARKHDPVDAFVMGNMAIIQSALGHHREALQSALQSLVIEPNQPWILYNCGIYHSKLGQQRMSMECYSKALALKPDMIAAYINRGNIYAKLGDHRRALDDARMVLKRSKDDKDIHDALLLTGLVCLQRGAHEESLEAYRRALLKQPKSPEAHNSMGYALANLYRYEQALRCFQDALKLDPKNEGALVNSAKVYQEQGQYKKALDLLERVLSRDPESFLGRRVRAYVLLDMNRISAAHRDLEWTLERSPHDHFSMFKFSVVLHHQGRQDEALEWLEKAIKIHDRNPDYHYNRAIFYRLKKNLKQAMASVDTCLKLNPKYALGHLEKGLLLDRQRDPEGAVKAYSQALKFGASPGHVYTNRGLIYFRWKKPELAIKDFREGLKINPQDQTAWLFLARALLIQKRLASARLIYQQILKQFPPESQVHKEALIDIKQRLPAKRGDAKEGRS